ncbi:MAG: sensor histidine kinase, partial [Symploca sp. SIO1C4]|nr:sensor histidine kinase [Symploca sp. SIO1C4]
MHKFLPKNHPFRLLLYLEWILLGIAVLAVFSPLPFPHPPRALRLHPPRLRFPIAAAVSIVTLGLMGLRLPVKSRLLSGIIYTSLGFGLSWLAVMLAGRGGSVFPSLLLVVVMRACVMFPWSGRLLVAGFAYISFLLMQLMSFLEIRPLGVSLGRPLPRVFRHMPSELLHGIIIHFTL